MDIINIISLLTFREIALQAIIMFMFMELDNFFKHKNWSCRSLNPKMIDWLKCKILLKWSLDSENGGKKVLRLLFYPLGSEALDFIRKIYFRNFAVGEGQTTAECFVFALYNQKLLNHVI